MATDVFRRAALKYLLAHAQGQEGEELLNYFESKEQDEICNAINLPKDPFQSLSSPSSWLKLIHPLWILQALESCPKPHHLFISALPQSIQQELPPTKEKPLQSSLTDLAKEFLEQILIKHLLGSFSFFPPQSLPSHSLNQLVTLSPSLFEKYCRIVGIFDLVVELKTVVNPHLLRQMDAHFSPLEKKCVQQFSKKPNLLKFTSLKLNHWNGNIEDLLKVLYYRGLNRVAKGLFDAPASLLWYVERKVPPDQVTFIETLKSPIHQQKIHNILVEQLLECVDIIQSHFQEGNLL